MEKKEKKQQQLGNNNNAEEYWATFRYPESLTNEQSFRLFWQLVHPDKILFDFQCGEYELDGKKYPGMFQVLENNKLVWVKKATGMGFTTFILTYIAWKCINDPSWKGTADAQVCIVTGQGIHRATDLMRRLKALFSDDYIFTEKETVATINNVRCEAFPADHIDAMRTLEHPRFIFIDEGDFFSPGQQQNSRATSERYIGKTKGQVQIVFGSTPNLPGGLFETMEKEANSIYHKVFWPYTVGLGKIYTHEAIQQAKQSPSFEREYNLKYGQGIGNIFPYQLVDAITTSSYDLSLGNGQKVLAVDPAYGSSKFAVLGIEELGGIFYVKEAKQYDRPDPESMLQELVRLYHSGYTTIACDSARPEIWEGLQRRGVSCVPVNFSKELSTMTANAVQAVKEQRVRIHPAFTELAYQLKAVEYNDKGHPDKSKLTFDLGDSLLMALAHLNSSAGGWAYLPSS